MNISVTKTNRLQGQIILPPNKSHSFRALIFASLANGISKIHEPKESADWNRGIKAMEMFGAQIDKKNNTYIIKGTGSKLKIPDNIIDCGNSGIVLRFLMGVASCCDGYSIFTGDDSIRHSRPAGPIVEGLNQLGAFAVCTKNDNHAPVIVRGKMKGGKTTVEGSDSQTVSGLLIGCSMAKASSEIIVKNAGEKPWVGVTLSWLDRVGIKYENIGGTFDHFKLPGKSRIKPFEFTVPKDWSAATYPIVAALIIPQSKIVLQGLDPQDVQGDKKTIEVLKKMGANIVVSDKKVVAQYSKLHGLDIDCNPFIDQFMILAVAASYAEGRTKLYNAEICRNKECDRISAMYTGLKKIGVDVVEQKDGLIINGGKPLKGTVIDGKKDHRIVMSYAIAALNAEGETIISDSESIEKSFDSFIPQMIQCDANFSLSKT